MLRCTFPLAAFAAFSLAAPALAQPLIVERLMLVGPSNDIVAVVDGDPDRVTIDAAIDRLLRQPGATIRMVHNHPNGSGLSLADLLQLMKPGVAAIVAEGADCSRYEAARGPRFNQTRFEGFYNRAYRQVVKDLLVARSHEPALPAFDGQIAHLTSLALHKAGVLQYRATLAGLRASEWNAYRPLLGPVTEAAAARVRESQDPQRSGRAARAW